MNEWIRRPLSEVVELQRGHDLPSQDRHEGKIPIIGSFGVTGSHDEAKYPGPGVTIGRSGAAFGTATYVEEAYWPLNTCLFVRDFKGNEPRWVYYLLDSMEFAAFNSGSAQPSLNRNFLRNISIALPPVCEQQAIAEVLGALDDKIAANAKLASSAGILGSALFSKAVEAPDIRRVQLREVAKNVAGRYLAKDRYVNEGPYYVYGSNSVMGRHDKAIVPGGFAVLAKIGSYCGNLRWSQRPAWVNNNASAIVPTPNVNPWILRHALNRIDMLPHRAGTGQPYIRMESLFSSWLELPPASESARIAPLLESLSEIEAQISEESVSLAATRDSLVPQLMSGALRVEDAERALEVVV